MAKKEDKKEEVVTKDMESLALSKALIKEFNKDAAKHGKVAWSLAFDDDNPTDVKTFLSTGNTLLNYIISNRRDGGIPVGKLTEITGEEASGKSLICAHLIAEVQRRGGIAIYIDTENSANPDFLQRVGVNIKEMVYLQPGCVEDVGDAIVKTIVMARAKAPGKIILIVWDGIAATPCRCELEGNFDLNMNTQLEKSKVLSKMMRMIGDTVGKEQVALVFTNQLKVKIGVQYGDPMTTPGGKSVPYAASVRLRLEAGKRKREGANPDAPDSEDGKGAIYGVHTRAKVVKNRLGPPFRKCEFDILFASGIDDESSWYQRLDEAGEILNKDGWRYLVSVPSGELEEKGVNEGKDLGIKFRESKWLEFLDSKPLVPKVDPKTGEVELDDKKKPVTVPFDVRKHVLDLLEKHMIVRYGETPKDMVMDPESLMDAEAVLQTVEAA